MAIMLQNVILTVCPSPKPEDKHTPMSVAIGSDPPATLRDFKEICYLAPVPHSSGGIP